jgi:hypothetical protein
MQQCERVCALVEIYQYVCVIISMLLSSSRCVLGVVSVVVGRRSHPLTCDVEYSGLRWSSLELRARCRQYGHHSAEP